jgi:hypothetical protein
MADKNDIDYKLAQRELHDALNELRKLQGEPPLTFMPTDAPGPEHCSFYDKGKDEVAALVAGPAVYICNKCIAAANKLLGDE